MRRIGGAGALGRGGRGVVEGANERVGWVDEG